MNSRVIRRGPALAVFLAGILVASTSTTVYAQQKGALERFTATSANVSGAGGAVKIDLLRWSTDAEREQMLAAFAEKGDKEFQSTLDNAPTLGYLWTTESVGYSVRYAFRTSTADGGSRVVVATDRRLGSWNPQVWKPQAASGPEYTFTVLELRLNKAGTGEGKSSLHARVIADTDAKTIALENYAGAPVVLNSVKHEALASQSSN